MNTKAHEARQPAVQANPAKSLRPLDAEIIDLTLESDGDNTQLVEVPMQIIAEDVNAVEDASYSPHPVPSDSSAARRSLDSVDIVERIINEPLRASTEVSEFTYGTASRSPSLYRTPAVPPKSQQAYIPSSTAAQTNVRASRIRMVSSGALVIHSDNTTSIPGRSPGETSQSLPQLPFRSSEPPPPQQDPALEVAEGRSIANRVVEEDGHSDLVAPSGEEGNSHPTGIEWVENEEGSICLAKLTEPNDKARRFLFDACGIYGVSMRGSVEWLSWTKPR